MESSVALQQKQAFGQLFVEVVYIFPIIFSRKSDPRIADLFFSLLYGNKDSFIIINFLKFALKNWGFEYNWLTLNIVFLL